MASIRKRNDKWQAQVRRVGISPRTKSFINKADAIRWVRQTETEMDRAGLAYDPSALERITVSDLLRRYRDEVTPNKRGRASEAKRIEVLLRERWTQLTLARITPQVFTRYRDMRLRCVSAGTIIRELGMLHAIFETARREWDLPLLENPVARVRKPKAPKGRTRRLQPIELDALMTACTDCRSDWLRPSILLAVETGMRRGEILNIKVSHVDRENRLLDIPETKTDEPRTIPLTDRAVSILDQLIEKCGRFDRQLVPASPNAFRLAWERCKRRASHGVPSLADLRFHDLRHEAVSRFFEMGLNVPEVAAISGHKDPRMLFRYTHLKPQDIVTKLRLLTAEMAA